MMLLYPKIKRLQAATVQIFLITTLLAGCAAGASMQGQPETASAPVAISVWTYYNGAQLTAFNALVEEFNATVGKEKGIVVTGDHLGSVADLQDAVRDAADGKVGAKSMPNIFSAYADTAFAMDQRGMLADIGAYLTEEEASRFVASFLEEGHFSGEEALKILPTAKSVEVMQLNKVDWEPFAAATGATFDDFRTMEGLTATAQKYYEWTDSLTPVPYDGKAFFGRDAMANYFFIGAMQMGTQILTVKDGVARLDFREHIVRRLWDNYYVPFIKGYFAASARFRSDDVKTGNIIALVGSSSGATYFPTEVIINDKEVREVEMLVFPAPQFANGKSYAVQQGAGMVVAESTPEEVEASVTFLKWFTQDENNVRFAVESGYLPVSATANKMSIILEQHPDIDSRMEQILSVAVETVQDNTLYTPPAFSNGTALRDTLEVAMSDVAVADRAVVEKRLSEGMTLEEATAEFLTDFYFDTWYQSVETRLKALFPE